MPYLFLFGLGHTASQILNNIIKKYIDNQAAYYNTATCLL